MLLLAERAQKVKFDSATASATVSWRDNLLIHPAVELFPPMSSDELRALGEDIVKNGFTSPIVLWRARPNERAILLDGRSRLDATEMATGRAVEVDGSSVMAGEFLATNKVIVLDGRSVDPWAYAISANIRRRHLTIEDTDRLTVELLKADPTKSSRQVAKIVGASRPHVAKVRRQAEQAGHVETVSTTVDTKGRGQPAKRPRNQTRAVRAVAVSEMGAPRFAADHDGGDSADHGDARGGGRGDKHAEQPAISMQARIDELTHEVRVRDIRIHALEGEIADLKTAAAEACQQSADLVTAWNNATDAELAAGLTAIGLSAVLRVMPGWKTETVRRITDWPQGRPAGHNPLTAALRSALSHLAAATAPQADVQAEELAALNALRGITRLNPNYHTLTITVQKERRPSRRQCRAAYAESSDGPPHPLRDKEKAQRFRRWASEANMEPSRGCISDCDQAHY
jgi:DNA-binding Lrp family transcriptional regulator